MEEEFVRIVDDVVLGSFIIIAGARSSFLVFNILDTSIPRDSLKLWHAVVLLRSSAASLVALICVDGSFACIVVWVDDCLILRPPV